jgi:hypothetical protein
MKKIPTASAATPKAKSAVGQSITQDPAAATPRGASSTTARQQIRIDRFKMRLRRYVATPAKVSELNSPVLGVR